MKQRLFLPTLLCVVLFVPAAFGQRVRINSDHSTGTFQVPTGNSATINASYSIRPATPDNIVLVIAPKGEFDLNAHIVDSRGREVARIPSQHVGLRYANSIDISKLAPGNYSIEMLNGGVKGYNIPFSVAPKSARASTDQAK